MAENNKGPSEMGRLIGRTKMQVYRYVNCGAIPRGEAMTKIVEVTDGKVTPADFYGETKA